MKPPAIPDFRDTSITVKLDDGEPYTFAQDDMTDKSAADKLADWIIEEIWKQQPNTK